MLRKMDDEEIGEKKSRSVLPPPVEESQTESSAIEMIR